MNETIAFWIVALPAFTVLMIAGLLLTDYLFDRPQLLGAVTLTIFLWALWTVLT